MRQEIPFNGGTQEGILNLVGRQASINMRPQIQKPGDKNKISQYSCYGLKRLSSAGLGPCRSNFYLFKSKLYFVTGVEFIEIDTSGVYTSIGTITTTTSRVEMAVGRDYIALVDGTDGFTYSSTYSTFSQIKQFSSGNADTNTANKLEDSTATFISDGVKAGTVVYNTTDSLNGIVSAVDSETVLSIVNTSGAAYDLFPLGTEAYEVGSDDFPSNPSHIAYLLGYFLVNKGSSDAFYRSLVENPTAYAALDFANAEALPDKLVAIATSQSQNLYLGGETSTQVYYDSKNPDFNFEPYANGAMSVGVKAPHSMVTSAQGVLWLGTTAEGEVRVIKAQGFQPIVISNEDIDYQISEMADPTDAYAWIEQDGDRTLYVLTFPGADRTFCYDLMLPKDLGWFEKKSTGIGRWRASGYGSIGNKRVIGDYSSGIVYTLERDTYDENGAILKRLRRTQIIHQDKKEVTINELVLDVEVGRGLSNGQGSDPKVVMRYSHDGGSTWSAQLWEDLGRIGKRRTEVYWSKLGAARSWMFEIWITDPVPFAILSMYADIEVAEW